MKLVVFFSCICLCWAVITCTPQQRYWIPISTGTYTASWVYGKTRDLLAGRLFMRGFNSGDFYELYRKDIYYPYHLRGENFKLVFKAFPVYGPPRPLHCTARLNRRIIQRPFTWGVYCRPYWR